MKVPSELLYCIFLDTPVYSIPQSLSIKNFIQFDLGCIRDIYSITSLLGVLSEVVFFEGPMKITKGCVD